MKKISQRWLHSGLPLNCESWDCGFESKNRLIIVGQGSLLKMFLNSIEQKLKIYSQRWLLSGRALNYRSWDCEFESKNRWTIAEQGSLLKVLKSQTRKSWTTLTSNGSTVVEHSTASTEIMGLSPRTCSINYSTAARLNLIFFSAMSHWRWYLSMTPRQWGQRQSD